MNLSPQDADLFFKLMWSLQIYVGRQLGILPDVDSVEAYLARSRQDKMQVRDALYKHLDLIDRFVAENPARLSPQELAIVRGWKRFLAGPFYIERFLKKATIFVDNRNPPKVYAVLGLRDRLEEMFYGRPTPIMVDAVLLPFKGRIVYDGMLNIYNIYFGSGIRGTLKEIYAAARQNGRIIETLEPEQKASPVPPRPSTDWRPVVDELLQTAEKLKGGESPLQAPAFNLLKASARLAQAAAHDPDDLDTLWELGRKVQTALRRLETVLERAEM